jgi:hypothetical protein
MLFTITPRQSSLQQRWPIVAKDRAASKVLEIQGVALDDKRCFVLLQPNPELAANRIDGRLRLDLLIANCNFAKDRLEFDTPRVVGRKQGSFTAPRLSLHGEFLVITEELAVDGWPVDQQELERHAADRASTCVHLLLSESGRGARRLNSICARLGKGAADKLNVSPDGNYVAIESTSAPLIVARDYRNEGTGPDWLTNGGPP